MQKFRANLQNDGCKKKKKADGEQPGGEKEIKERREYKTWKEVRGNNEGMKERGRGGRERDEAYNNGGNEKMTPREWRKLRKESWNEEEDGENEGMTGGGQKH